MLLWKGVEEFVRVVEKGSFSAAAKAMGLSKSHLSKQVKTLEDHLGTTLIYRTTRQLNLTHQGEIFFLKCQTLLQEMDAARAQVVNEVARPRGHIRLTVAGAFGEDVLSPLIAQFLREYPQVSIDMTFTNRQVDLVEEQFDLAIRSSAPQRSIPHGTEIYRYSLITAAHPDYLARHGAPTSPSDLKHYNCLCGTLPYWRFLQSGQIREVPITGNWHANNGRALVHGAQAGLGIIQVPDFYIQEAVTTGQLSEILIPYKMTTNSFWAIHPKSHHLPRKVQMLVDHIRKANMTSPSAR